METKKRTEHRSVTERWVVTGALRLETPAHFGNGDADALTDMPLLVDEAHGKPLLPGTSIAGALRNYLRERALGYGKKEDINTLSSMLFGGFRGDDDGDQSPLIVFDASGHASGIELRDGVAIDPETRTAADEKKFDIQLLAAGSTFDLRFELVVSKDSQALRNALYTALHGLELGDITLGARKRRGFGQVTVTGWEVYKFDLKTKEGLVNWLGFDQGLKTPTAEKGNNLATKLDVKITDEELKQTDSRSSAHLIAHFAIDGTLLIRSGFGETGNSPDTVHIRSTRDGKSVPIIPGTTLAGVLRQRALKIARTVSGDLLAKKDGQLIIRKIADKEVVLKKADVFVEEMFGPAVIERKDSKNTKASRVSIKETEIKKDSTTSLVITRVKIDRFTGGAYEAALFSEQPEIGKPDTQSVTLDLTLRSPKEAELGLLLLLLKDLWTGDLPIGGESSVGRGRLKGLDATLAAPSTQEIPQKTSWTFTAEGESLQVKESNNVAPEKLEKWVKAFNEEVQKEQVSHA